MQALIVYAHPSPDSYTAAVLEVVRSGLKTAGADVTILDLYAEGFAPVLSPAEWNGYMNSTPQDDTVARHIAALKAADTLIFIYPTWWYGLPALLKGWLDRVLLPGVAFEIPKDGPITPSLRHITRLGVFTTCGASWWLTQFIGAPGRRTLLRGVGLLCAPRRRVAFAAHYGMDQSTSESRTRRTSLRSGLIANK